MGLKFTVPAADFRAVPSSGHRMGSRGHGSAAVGIGQRDYWRTGYPAGQTAAATLENG